MYGKATVFEKGTSCDDARDLLGLVGQALPVTQTVLDDISKFTIRLIYNDKLA